MEYMEYEEVKTGLTLIDDLCEEWKKDLEDKSCKEVVIEEKSYKISLEWKMGPPLIFEMSSDLRAAPRKGKMDFLQQMLYFLENEIARIYYSNKD